MRQWLTAQEIAAEALPGLPSTKRNINALADQDRWNESLGLARRRAGHGGGFEYNVALLPTTARLAYEARHRTVAQLELPIVAAAPSGLTARGTEERDARLAVLAAFAEHCRGQQLSLASLVQIFVDRYNAGTLTVDPWVRERLPSLSKRSLQRWKAAKEARVPERLAVDPSLARKGTGLLDVANGGAVRTYMLALIAHQPHLSAHHVRKLVRSEFGDTILDRNGDAAAVPPVRTFQHVLKGLKQTEKVALTKLTNPDLYRSTMAPRGTGALRHVTKANQLWQIDASPTDALCVDGRHAIYACIDIATRRSLFYISKTPRASAVAMLVRLAVLKWGVPKVIKTDNGSDFVAQATKRLFTSLDIELQVSDAYQPQQKGHVERLIRTFQHEVATLLPGFVGHSVADRKVIENRKSFEDRQGQCADELFGVTLTGPQLQAHADDWADVTYANRVHTTLKISPAQAAAACRAPIRRVDERALDVLLMAAPENGGLRTVQASGVRIAGYAYVINAALPGDRVLMRMDPNDAGRALAFDAATGRFVGPATCAELADVDPKKLLAAKKAMQTEIIDLRLGDARKEAKRIAQGRPLIERALEVDRRDVAQNVLAFPKREEVHTTPDVEAAIAAMEARAAAAQDEIDPAEVLAHLELRRSQTVAHESERARARVAHLPPEVAALPETPKQRFMRSLAVRAAAAEGDSNFADGLWLAGYETGSEYRALSKLYADNPDWLEG